MAFVIKSLEEIIEKIDEFDEEVFFEKLDFLWEKFIAIKEEDHDSV